MAARTQSSNSLDVAVTSATTSTIVATGIGAYVGFHLAIVSSTVGAQNQMRYAYASAGTDRLRVTPPFDVVPTANDDLSIAKNQDNYDADYGNDWKLVLKATSEWDVGASPHTVGNGTNHMVGGIYNQAISQDEEILVKNGSYFAVGALFDGESLGGWYWNSNNSISTLGFAYIQAETSATVMLHNLNCGTVFAHSLLFQSNSFFYAYDVSFTNLMYDGARLKGNTYGNNLKFQGNGVANDYVVVASTMATFDGPIILSDSYGFQSSALNETIRINKYVSVGNAQDIEAHNSTTWQFVNPTWTNPEILWTQATGQSTVSEIFTIEGTTQQTDGTAIASALYVLTEGSATVRQSSNIAIADASGVFNENVLKRYWASSTASTTYGPFVSRTWKYGYAPFEGATLFESEVFATIAMASDGEITTSTAASALSHSAVFTDETATFDGLWHVQVSVTATALVSAVVSAPGGYHGTIREVYTAGDGLTQQWFLVNTSSTTGTPASTVVTWSQAGTARGDNVAGSDHNFTYHIDAKNETLTNTYDKQQAEFADTSTTEAWVSTARQRSTRLVDKTGDSYATEAYFSTGCFISNRGTGTIEYMTADDGWTFTPPASYSYTLTGLKTDSEVRIYNAADDSELGGIESSGTSFAYNYTYGGSDITAYVIVFHLDWKEVRLLNQTLSNSNQSIPIQQSIDRVYRNP
jgi:hypothetical protein